VKTAPISNAGADTVAGLFGLIAGLFGLTLMLLFWWTLWRLFWWAVGRRTRKIARLVDEDRRRRERASIIAVVLTCSTWQGVRTCTDSSGYVSHESTWNGITTGDDNRGDHWTTSTWMDNETTTIEPPADR
jgi:hypothetical protein